MTLLVAPQQSHACGAAGSRAQFCSMVRSLFRLKLRLTSYGSTCRRLAGKGRKHQRGEFYHTECHLSDISSCRLNRLYRVFD